jgi:dTDP-4-dehydrorhamnose 3,5-epimerase
MASPRSLSVAATPIAGAFVVTGAPFEDARGAFARVFCEAELAPQLAGRRIVQVNRSLTRRRGAIRGLHYQRPPSAEMKFVSCLKGKVWDVIVDLRAGSATLLQWHAEELSAATPRMVVVPEGCAHGFQVLEPDSELLYFHTAAYAPAAEAGVRYDEPRLAIRWPLAPADVSERDRSHPLLDAAFAGVRP